MSKSKPSTVFKKPKKLIMTSFFPVSVLVSNFAGLGFEAKVEIGFGLGKILQSRSWLRRVGFDYSPGFQPV